MNIKIPLIIFVLLISSCSKPTIEYLGCQWNVPKEKEEEANSYFVVDEVDGLMTLSFWGSDFKAPSSKYYEFIEGFEEKSLSVMAFESTAEAPRIGIKLYVVSREGYEGYVTSFNSDYRSFLSHCTDKLMVNQ